MQFFASWWERFPKQAVASTLVAVFVLANEAEVEEIVRKVFGPCGFMWG